MVQEMLATYNQRLREAVEHSEPLVSATTDTKEYQLIEVFEPDATPLVRTGLYAVVVDNGSTTNIQSFGMLEPAGFTASKSAYLSHIPDEYHDAIQANYAAIRSLEISRIRSAFNSAFQIPTQRDGIRFDTITGNTVYLTPEEQADTFADLFTRASSNAFGYDPEAYGLDDMESLEGIDIEAFSDALDNARAEFWRQKTSAVGSEWQGIAIQLEFDDWREDARRLNVETSLSSGQALAWAVAAQGFTQSEVGQILGKDQSVISRQLNAAADKYVTAERTVEVIDDIGKGNGTQQAIEQAQESLEAEIAEAKDEREEAP